MRSRNLALDLNEVAVGPDALPAAVAAGVEIANLANNHGRDYGEEALLDSRAVLTAAGIQPVGVGANIAEAMLPAPLHGRPPTGLIGRFVPRGYAVVLLDMVGANNSTGCPVIGGTADNRSAIVAIDWLNGRRDGFDAGGNSVADWHNGRAGMIGKSYDRDAGERRGRRGRRGAATSASRRGVREARTVPPLAARRRLRADVGRTPRERRLGDDYVANSTLAPSRPTPPGTII